MISQIEMLQNIYEGIDMGRKGIEDVLKFTDEEKLRQALMQQLTEYDKLAESTAKMLQERGEQPQGSGVLARISSQLMSAIQTMSDRSSSKVAELMIKGNTMGMTQSIRDLNDYDNRDERILDLAHKLLATEQANIEQMKKFL